MKLDKNYRQKLKVYTISIILFFILWNLKDVSGVLSKAISIFTPFLIGFAIAFIVNLPLNFIEDKIFKKVIKSEKRKSIRHAISILVSYLLVFIIIIFLLYIIIPQLIESMNSLFSRIPVFFEMVIEKMREYSVFDRLRYTLENEMDNVNWNNAMKTAARFVTKGSAQSFSMIGGVLNTIFSSLLNILLGLVFSIYVLLSKDKLKYQSNRMLYSLFKEKIADYLNHVASVSYESFSGFLQGQMTIATILGIMCFIGMLVLRLPYAAMISVLIGFTDLIPVLGPFLGGAIGALLIFIENPMQALVFIIFVVVIQQIESNVTYPLIVGNKIGIPSMWTLVAITVGASLYGVLGMILFVPLFSVIYVLLGEFTNYMLKKREVRIEDKTQKP
ncbi:MAG: AI-2E family transporter [Tissierellia bacterium]|nr:AI-2E family transporter [Tissierellia bacterium]